MLVKENVLNEINKEGTFTQGFKDCKKITRKEKFQRIISKFRRLSKLADKGNCWNCQLSVKASSGKVWLLYGFSFSLNPGDKPNDAQALRTINHYIQ